MGLLKKSGDIEQGTLDGVMKLMEKLQNMSAYVVPPQVQDETTYVSSDESKITVVSVTISLRRMDLG